MELTRLIVTQPDGTIVGDIDPTLIVDAGFVQEVNGEHSITLSTFRKKRVNLLSADRLKANVRARSRAESLIDTVV